MDKETKLRIRNTLSRIVEALVRGNYVALENITGGVRLKAEHLEAGVNEYGRTLSIPPLEAFDKIDVIKIQGPSPPAYSIRFRLFTEIEGESDLEIQATFIDDEPASGMMRAEIDGILVP